MTRHLLFHALLEYPYSAFLKTNHHERVVDGFLSVLHLLVCVQLLLEDTLIAPHRAKFPDKLFHVFLGLFDDRIGRLCILRPNNASAESEPQDRCGHQAHRARECGR